MDFIQRRHFEEKYAFFEMDNLRKQESGLQYDIWLDSSGFARNTQNKVMRIKVGVGDELIPVIIFSKRDIRPLRPFRMENEIVSWVCDNYDTLFKHWNGELSDRQALNLLSKDLEILSSNSPFFS